MDSESELCIQKAIERFSGEITMVIVAHRLSTINKVDCVYVLDDGRMLEKGTYKDLTHGTGHFHSMVQSQELAV